MRTQLALQFFEVSTHLERLSHLSDSSGYLPDTLEADDWFLSRGDDTSNSLVNKLDFTSFFSYILFDR